MVAVGINNYKLNNTHPLNFGARTRSERQAEREKSYTNFIQVTIPEENFEPSTISSRSATNRHSYEPQNIDEDEMFLAAEKQYNDDVRELRETQQIIREMTTPNKEKNIFAGSTLQKLGKAADVVITATLSGMALHWSTGKAFTMLHKISKKPKVAKAINNTKEPFRILSSALNEGAKTTWNTIAKKVKATPKGQKLINSEPIKTLNKWVEKAKVSYSNIKSDTKNITADNVKAGISTTFGISGFVAGAVDKLDVQQNATNHRGI